MQFITLNLASPLVKVFDPLPANIVELEFNITGILVFLLRLRSGMFPFFDRGNSAATILIVVYNRKSAFAH